MTILGPNWPSTNLLRQLLTDCYPQFQVAWGVAHPTAFGGKPRLTALSQLAALKAGGLNVPDYTTDLAEATQWVKLGSLVFGRLQVHTKGRDIVGPRHPLWKRREWWSKVIPDVQEEWRIHVVRYPSGTYRSIARGLKVNTGETWRKLPVKNRNNGWRLEHRSDPCNAVRDAAKAAVEAVKYDFGAVDLLHTGDGSVFILEVNKAPGLDNYTATQYAAAFKAIAAKQ